MNPPTRTPVIAVLTSVLLYAVATALPVVQIELFGDKDATPGWEALVYGWSPPTLAAWLGNFPWLLGLILLLRRKYAAASVTGIIAFALGATILWVLREDLTVLRPGYALWMASFLVVTVSGVLLWRRDIKER